MIFGLFLNSGPLEVQGTKGNFRKPWARTLLLSAGSHPKRSQVYSQDILCIPDLGTI